MWHDQEHCTLACNHPSVSRIIEQNIRKNLVSAQLQLCDGLCPDSRMIFSMMCVCEKLPAHACDHTAVLANLCCSAGPTTSRIHDQVQLREASAKAYS